MAIAGGAFAGGVVRAWTSSKLNRTDWRIPYGTLIVNLAGSFILGMMVGLMMHGVVSPNVKALVVTGFCGGLTTFSTFISEVVALFDDGRGMHAWAYWIGSVILGLACVWLGMVLTQ
ncbi:fluoride efflux transporter CrcB [Bifidobacterium pseudolongum]|uniref:fluoride efflux transporter CrcB n=1 Tax=Bifidobacterium pseudolongum TaxID=1694 RepID=UPI00209DAAF7|nr:fluoride efflux transporter CrcB [Bifidobacterium pseudolongum]